MLKKLNFHPALHGLHFVNNFTNHVGPFTTRGLCGGMALAAFSYYRFGYPVPTHTRNVNNFGTSDDVPVEGSRLRTMIYNLQIGSFASAGPFIYIDPNEDNHFKWSIGEFTRIKNAIDGNKFILLGLRSGFAAGHQVLVYGYDDSIPRIFIYDSNFRDEEIMIDLDNTSHRLIHCHANGSGTGIHYLSYFVQLELDPNRPDLFTNINRPSYTDLALTSGIEIINTVPGARIVNQPLQYQVKVRNFGEYDARFNHLHIYVRDPSSGNRDAQYGLADTVPVLRPGEERLLTRNLPQFGNAPGVWEIGVSYLSEQNNWIMVPNYLVPNTFNKVNLNVLPSTVQTQNWYSVGTNIASEPAATKNLDGRIEVFARRNDNKVYRLYQRSVNVPNDCSGLELLQGDQTFDGNISPILNQANCLEIFVRGRDNALWHRWQNRSNVTSTADWSGWTSRGGSIKSDPEAGMNQDKRLEVFAIGTDDRVYKIYHRFVGGWWSGFELLDSAMRFKGRLSVKSDAMGRIHVAARGFDDAVWINYQVTPNGPYKGWVSFAGLFTGDPVIAKNDDGRLELFGRGSDGATYHKWQLVPNGAWSNGWIKLDMNGVAPGTKVNARIAQTNNTLGAIELSETGMDFKVQHTGRINAAPYWTNWSNKSGAIVSNPAIACNPNGTIELFGVNASNDLMHTWFNR